MGFLPTGASCYHSSCSTTRSHLQIGPKTPLSAALGHSLPRASAADRAAVALATEPGPPHRRRRLRPEREAGSNEGGPGPGSPPAAGQAAAAPARPLGRRAVPPGTASCFQRFVTWPGKNWSPTKAWHGRVWLC